MNFDDALAEQPRAHQAGMTWVARTLTPEHRARLDEELRARRYSRDRLAAALRRLGYGEATGPKLTFYAKNHLAIRDD